MVRQRYLPLANALNAFASEWLAAIALFLLVMLVVESMLSEKAFSLITVYTHHHRSRALFNFNLLYKSQSTVIR